MTSQQTRSLLVSTADGQPDPIGSTANFLLRAAAHVDAGEPVLMSYLVYFTKPSSVQRAHDLARRSGWRATLYAVPDSYVLRLTRRRLLSDGRLISERDEMRQIADAYDGEWRHVLLEQGDGGRRWTRLAQGAQRARGGTSERGPAPPGVSCASDRCVDWYRSSSSGSG